MSGKCFKEINRAYLVALTGLFTVAFSTPSFALLPSILPSVLPSVLPSLPLPGPLSAWLSWLLGGPTRCGGPATGTIGNVLCNVDFAWSLVPGLLTGFSYLMGLVLGYWAIVKTKDHVENPMQTRLNEPLQRFIAGGAFFALPAVMEATWRSLTNGAWFGNAESGFSGATSGGGLDTMIVALMNDIWVPLANVLGGFTYLAGIVFIMIGISRLIKSAQEGPRGPGGFGTLMTFMVGGALFSVDSMLGGFSNSLFATNNVTTFATLAFTSGMTATEVNHVEAVISGVEAFMMVLGWISFIRGWFIIRGVAEGDQQASLMAGLTHLFGGALAVNLGPVMNAVQTTLGLTAYGVNFS